MARRKKKARKGKRKVARRGKRRAKKNPRRKAKRKASRRGRKGRKKTTRRAKSRRAKSRRGKRRSRRSNPRRYVARFPGLGNRKRSKRSGKMYRIRSTARRVLRELVKRGHALRSKRGKTYLKLRNPRGNRTKMGRSKYLHMLLRGGRKGGATKVQHRHLRRLRLGKPVTMGRYSGMTRLFGKNPVDVVGVLSTVAGVGAGLVMAQKVVPALAAKVSPRLSGGAVGVAVGAVGAIAASKFIAKRSPAAGQAVYAGALASIGLVLVKKVLDMLPANVKAPLGLSGVLPVGAMIRGEAMYSPSMGGMNDFLQLSGPVPEQLFAGGLNDYVDFRSKAAGNAAEAISAQVTEWTPTTGESF